MRLILAAALCAVSAAPALAQLPAPLEAALSVAPRDLSPSALDFRLENGGDGVTVRVAFEDGEPGYTLVEPAEADLTEAEREMWEDFLDPEDDAFREEPEEDGAEASVSPLDPVDLRGVVGETARLAREENGLLVYAFEPQSMPMGSDEDGDGDDMMARMSEHLIGEIAVDPARGEPAWLRLTSNASFKPNIAVRINSFTLTQTFVHEPALAGHRLERMEMVIAGSAAFQAFEQSMVMAFTNLVFEEGEAQSGDLGVAAESP